MTRRKKVHGLALSIILAATVPLLALLCRGHTPDRFASANLPFWERRLPVPVPARAVDRLAPLASGAVDYQNHAILKTLLHANADTLLAGLEHPRPGQSPEAAGRAGLWLEQACLLGRSDTRLNTRQDQIAARLLDAQGADGSLGLTPAGSAEPTIDRTATAENLRGLLAYYAVTRSPAAIYGAMRAGDLLLAEYRGVSGAGGARPPVAAGLSRLFLATGDSKYLAGASRAARADPADGRGQCALYEATGRAEFLAAAQHAWAEDSAAAAPDMAALAVELLKLTGVADYAAWLSAHRPGPLWLHAVAYTRAPDGIVVTGGLDSQATFGRVQVRQQIGIGNDSLRRTITVKAPGAASFRLSLFVPPAAAAPKVLLNHVPLRRRATPGRYLALTRCWKSGDQVTLVSIRPAVRGGNGTRGERPGRG